MLMVWLLLFIGIVVKASQNRVCFVSMMVAGWIWRELLRREIWVCADMKCKQTVNSVLMYIGLHHISITVDRQMNQLL